MEQCDQMSSQRLLQRVWILNFKTYQWPLVLTADRFGFCGTTEDFCGDEEVERPSCSASGKSIDKVIGYFESWSLTERDCFGMKPIDIPVGIYTHIK
jgi:chitinase